MGIGEEAQQLGLLVSVPVSTRASLFSNISYIAVPCNKSLEKKCAADLKM